MEMPLFLFSAFVVCSIPALSAAVDCQPTSCSKDGPTIRFPFRRRDLHRQECGYPGFDLYCNNNKETILRLPVSIEVAVTKIDYASQNLQFHDPGRCMPQKMPNLNLSASPFHFNALNQDNYANLDSYTLFNCSTNVRREVKGSVPCLEGPGYGVYAVSNFPLLGAFTQDPYISSSSLSSCTKIREIMSVPSAVLSDTEDILLHWDKPACRDCEAQGKFCGLKNRTTGNQIQCIDKPKRISGQVRRLVIAGTAVGSFLLVAAIGALCYFCYTVRANKENIEKFLKDYKAQKPTRFTYSDIRMITNHFNQKLGEGGYGTVYKGKLSNEAYVAVKVLSNGNGSGKEFINEVSIIGRIHHVNVVRLVGCCAEGLTRALVYEFLPNGSLEKYIFQDGSNSEALSTKKLHDIALGIAHGIEYLQHGCDQQILHFDIKPQNILLEDDFNPKISDFGLAKLYSKEQSVVSITSGRGTMGYVAPEVLSRAFGKVSYKSDIYSYGMVLLEMVGGRIFEHLDMNSEQEYMPQRIYNHLLLLNKKEMAVQKPRDNESKILRKLTVVGLWCIQWNPADRPSMKAAIQMLEGDGDNLTMPPNPFPDTNAATPMEGDFANMIKQKLVVISESS